MTRARSRVTLICYACQEKLESLTYDEEGMPRAISCPDRSVLERMAEGTLGTYAWETVENHLETCKGCQADFDALAGGEDDWAQQVKSLKRQRVPESPGLKRVIGALKDEGGPRPRRDSGRPRSTRPSSSASSIPPTCRATWASSGPTA